jgi:uridine nucleosidase
MYQALIACPANTAWLVTSGTLTNAALLVSTYPEVVHHLRGLSIMGGAVGSNFTDADLGKSFVDEAGTLRDRVGNHTPYAEFNIWCDPESAQSIFSHPQLNKKITLITLDLTHQVFATKMMQDLVLYSKQEENKEPTRLRRMFYELLTFFSKTYADVFGLSDGPPLHDPLAVAVLLADAASELTKIKFEDGDGERFTVDVDLSEPELGRTKVKAALEGIRIPRSLDTDQFWIVLNQCLEQAVGQVERMPNPR